MNTKTIIATVAFIGMATVASRANAAVTISAQACHQLYQADFNKISYNNIGVTTTSSATSYVNVECPVVRQSLSSGVTYQYFYIDGVHYSAQSTSCGISLEDYNGVIKYGTTSTATTSAAGTWEISFSVPAAQATTWVYGHVLCQVPGNGQGAIYGISSN
jgi:hypothetical protein